MRLLVPRLSMERRTGKSLGFVLFLHYLVLLSQLGGGCVPRQAADRVQTATGSLFRHWCTGGQGAAGCNGSQLRHAAASGTDKRDVQILPTSVSANCLFETGRNKEEV